MWWQYSAVVMDALCCCSISTRSSIKHILPMPTAVQGAAATALRCTASSVHQMMSMLVPAHIADLTHRFCLVRQ